VEGRRKKKRGREEKEKLEKDGERRGGREENRKIGLVRE